MRPWLVESFVDLSRHTGSCYQASIEVGKTQGRGRQDSKHQHGERGLFEAIYLYPLDNNFRFIWAWNTPWLNRLK